MRFGQSSLGKLGQLEVSFRDRTMSSACQAGLVNNLKDGVAWALLPLFFAAQGLGHEIGLLTVNLLGDLGHWPARARGWISDHVKRKSLIVAGMLLQSLATVGFAIPPGFSWWVAESVLLGTGTALVYPTLIAVVSDAARTPDRAASVGIYRFLARQRLRGRRNRSRLDRGRCRVSRSDHHRRLPHWIIRARSRLPEARDGAARTPLFGPDRSEGTRLTDSVAIFTSPRISAG